MTPHDHDPDAPRDPIYVTPASGRHPFSPTASSSAAAADAATARLIAVMHELNNLLDGATRTLSLARRSLGELAIAPGLDPSISMQLETATTSLEQMAELLHTAMRPGAASVIKSNMRTAPLVEAITHALEAHRPLASECRVELLAEISPRLVLAEAGPIYPAIANGVRNAIEAIARSGLGSRVELIAELETLDGCEPEIVIDIVDDGPGPDEQSRKHAFDPGYTTKNEGFGVGLSLSRQIVRSLGGSITLGSRSPEDRLRPGGRGGHLTMRYPLKSS